LYPQTIKWGQEQNDCIEKIKENIRNNKKAAKRDGRVV
jgi:hypothetical protein